MPTLDIAAAKAAGYSDEEIQAFVAQQTGAAQSRLPTVSNKPSFFADDPTSQYWQERFGPLAGMGEGQKFLAGTGRGMVNVGRQVGNVTGLVPDSSLTDAAQRDAPLLNDPSGRLGNVAGETAALLPATMGGEYAAGLTGAGRALLARPILTGAVEGGGQGALLAGPGNRGTGALTGALTGGALPTAAAVGRRAVYGAPRTPEAQLLLDHGVPLTPGQMSPSGTANLMEQSAESVPVVGPTVKSARDNAEQEFGRAVIQKGAAPGTTIKPSMNVNEMFNDAAASWDPVYAQVHGYPVNPHIMTTGANIPLDQALQAAARTPGLTRQRQAALASWLQARLDALPQNPMSEDFIGKNGIRSAIRAYQRNLLNAKDVDAPIMTQALERAEQAVNATLSSQLPSDASRILADADRGYAQLKMIGNAVQKSGDQLSGLTPQKLSMAIRQGTDSGAYSRGAGGDLRDLARAGTSVFQTVAPPTGARVATGLVGAGLGYASPHVALPAMAAAGTAGFLGAATPIGRRLAAGQTAPQTATQRLVNALQSRIPNQDIVGLTARTAINSDPRMQAIAQRAPQLLPLLLPQK